MPPSARTRRLHGWACHRLKRHLQLRLATSRPRASSERSRKSSFLVSNRGGIGMETSLRTSRAQGDFEPTPTPPRRGTDRDRLPGGGRSMSATRLRAAAGADRAPLLGGVGVGRFMERELLERDKHLLPFGDFQARLLQLYAQPCFRNCDDCHQQGRSRSSRRCRSPDRAKAAAAIISRIEP